MGFYIMYNILVVCTGNTCRSPMGEAILNKLATDRQIPIEAKSAGIAAYPRDCVSENSVKAMAEIGIDIREHRARRLTQYDLDECDFIFCMSESHKNALVNYFDSDKIIVPEGGISDPYGGDMEIYCNCRDEIFRFCELFLNDIAKTVIEPMTDRTIGAVAELEKECFSVPWSSDSLKEELTNETAHFFTAKICNEVVGYIGTNIVLDECYITNVAVTKDLRRKGIAKALLEAAFDCCVKLSCSFITLEVRKSNEAAIKLYEKLGFELCGERKDFYSSPVENALIMTKFFNKD